MKHIYYRNDFAVEVELFNLEGMKVPLPEWKRKQEDEERKLSEQYGIPYKEEDNEEENSIK